MHALPWITIQNRYLRQRMYYSISLLSIVDFAIVAKKNLFWLSIVTSP